VLLWLAGLKELGDTRQTTGDVLGLDGLTRDTRNDVTGLDSLTVLHRDVGTDREEISRFLIGSRNLLGLAGVVFDRDARPGIGVFRLDNDLAG
jgi:hypothetical protein